MLTWIGVRSYGIYLWHWPLFMITRPDLDLPFTGCPLLVLRSWSPASPSSSYRFVEDPIRHGAHRALVGAVPVGDGRDPPPLARLRVGAAVAVVAVGSS